MILGNRIRPNLLRSHLFAHNFESVPSPSCPCGHKNQTVKHFFLDCTLLADNRTDLLLGLESLTVDVKFRNLNKNNKIKFLLYGDPNLTINDNDKVIEATSKFIANSKNIFKFGNLNNNNNNNDNNN